MGMFWARSQLKNKNVKEKNERKKREKKKKKKKRRKKFWERFSVFFLHWKKNFGKMLYGPPPPLIIGAEGAEKFFWDFSSTASGTCLSDATGLALYTRIK